jgi:predicted transcriptional regulator
MKPRKTKELKKVLSKKGFVIEPAKNHHEFFYLTFEGKKHNVYTYFSHGKKEYSSSLMSMLKKQLKFKEASKAEDFFDCPMSAQGYIDMLKENGDLR